VDNVGIVAYDLTRNELVSRVHTTMGAYVDASLDPSTTYTFTVAAVDGAGNVSGATAPLTFVTPADPFYPLNIALNKPYTTTSEADPGHPDVGGIQLTDGIHGPYATADDLWDPTWQGRTNAGNTWVIDLGSVQTIHEVNSTWFNDEPDYIDLPNSVTYACSVDGTTYQVLGTVNKGIVSSAFRKVFKVNRLDVQGRYVKVSAATNDGLWSFIDELEVRQ
jgi:hypothetical protein